MSHFQERALERYGLELSDKDVHGIIDIIRNGTNINNFDKSVFICRESNNISHWKILWAGVWIHVVYSKSRKTIVTALPRLAKAQAIIKQRLLESEIYGLIEELSSTRRLIIGLYISNAVVAVIAMTGIFV